MPYKLLEAQPDPSVCQRYITVHDTGKGFCCCEVFYYTDDLMQEEFWDYVYLSKAKFKEQHWACVDANKTAIMRDLPFVLPPEEIKLMAKIINQPTFTQKIAQAILKMIKT